MNWTRNSRRDSSRGRKRDKLPFRVNGAQEKFVINQTLTHEKVHQKLKKGYRESTNCSQDIMNLEMICKSTTNNLEDNHDESRRIIVQSKEAESQNESQIKKDEKAYLTKHAIAVKCQADAISELRENTFLRTQNSNNTSLNSFNENPIKLPIYDENTNNTAFTFTFTPFQNEKITESYMAFELPKTTRKESTNSEPSVFAFDDYRQVPDYQSHSPLPKSKKKISSELAFFL